MSLPRFVFATLLVAAGCAAAGCAAAGRAATSGGDPAQQRVAGADAIGAAPSSLWVMSFNLRYNNPADGPDAWPHRRDEVASTIRLHRTDVVGVQEARRGMIKDLAARLPSFEWFGQPRADGSASDEYSAIFYQPARLKLLSHDTFWLSETPAERASVGWDAALPRIVTWGKFEDRASGRVFFHFNTHFDHRGDTARAQSARLLRTRSARIAGDAPTVVTGDFNATPGARPYALLTEKAAAGESAFRDALSASAHGHHGPRSTWNGFRQIEPGRRIDFIFVRGERVRVEQHAILANTLAGGRFPSDHLPVLAEVRF